MAKRYTIRRQSDGDWCIWDTQTDKPAEAHGKRYIHLRQDEAVEDAESLNDG